MKAVSLWLLLVCVGVCVLGCSHDGHEDEKREDGVKTTWGGEKTKNWVFSVKPNQEVNRNTDEHTSQLPYLYSFCIPLQRTPVKDGKASAELELIFEGTTNEIVVDFDFTDKLDYVNKDPVTTTSISLLVDSEFGFGWAADKKLSGKVYTTAPLTHVMFKGTGDWEEIHEKDLLCSQPTTSQQVPEKPSSDVDDSAILIKTEHYPFVFLCLALLGFMSIMICCCTLSTVNVPEEEDLIKEMEQFSPIPQTEVEQPRVVEQRVVEHHVYIDDDEMMRRVQEESRREFEAQNEMSVGAQREALAQYMKAPVMTPEQYAAFLATQPQ